MDLVALVERARAGDVDAFTELVRRHQSLAVGSALSVLRDPDRARDVVQESFVAAWRGLARLADPKAFPAWLHGIVRRQALHALRARHLEPLAEAEHLAGDTLPADQHVEAAQRRMLALAALAELPDGLREPAVLRYVHDCSQAQIAAFLDLPVTTINNRLHAARARLKRGLGSVAPKARLCVPKARLCVPKARLCVPEARLSVPEARLCVVGPHVERRMLVMMKDTLRDRPLPEDFPARIGRIVRAEGSVAEARFEPAGPPELFSTLIAADEAGRAVTVEVVRHLPDGRVLAVARDSGLALAPGMQVVDRGEIGGPPLAEASIRAALDRLVLRSPSTAPRLLETGVKVIDVLMPIAQGGVVGILSGERVGTTVLVEELVRRLATADLSLFMFAPWVNAAGMRQAREEGYTLGVAGVKTFFFVGDGAPSRDAFDTVIVLSAAIAALKIWPAIDPLLSASRWLVPEVVGEEHVRVATQVRECLEQAVALQGRDDLDAAAKAIVGRARRLQRFFAQPFFVAEPYTKRPGAFVPRADAVAACAAIMDGVYDDIQEDAFYFTGGIYEVLARVGRPR
jgi:RNA polymerase sigma factor (sigma-70 family)